VYSTENQLKDLDEKLSDEQKKNIGDAKTRLETAMKENKEDIKPAMDELNKIWSEASTEMYSKEQPGAEGQPETAGEEAPKGKKKDDGNVEEADYTIVDDDK
ncbi:MAG: molecular chaperone DnaK, partial [Candidatus Kapabacteria bacterium]|nr:molecular chaperone DnaK [Candidatus Kapabacteria bacterium]